MTENTNDAPFGGEPSYAVQPPEKKNGILKWIMIGAAFLIVLGVGSCVMMFKNMFDMAEERKLPTVAFIEGAFENGLPSADSDIYVKGVGFDEEVIEKINRLQARTGQPTEFAPTSCSFNSSTSSGTFAPCSTSLTFENTTGVVTVTWQKKADDWKVAGYRFNVGDVDFLMDDDTEESPEQD